MSQCLHKSLILNFHSSPISSPFLNFRKSSFKRHPDSSKPFVSLKIFFSIPLNIAEGVGKRSTNDKKRFFAIARGSALECGAIIDSCKVLNLISEKQFVISKELLVRIVCMLSKLSS